MDDLERSTERYPCLDSLITLTDNSAAYSKCTGCAKSGFMLNYCLHYFEICCSAYCTPASLLNVFGNFWYARFLLSPASPADHRESAPVCFAALGLYASCAIVLRRSSRFHKYKLASCHGLTDKAALLSGSGEEGSSMHKSAVELRPNEAVSYFVSCVLCSTVCCLEASCHYLFLFTTSWRGRFRNFQ